VKECSRDFASDAFCERDGAVVKGNMHRRAIEVSFPNLEDFVGVKANASQLQIKGFRRLRWLGLLCVNPCRHAPKYQNQAGASYSSSSDVRHV
jgi:hypothetical protein